ncbi:MAG: hypothetical protein JEZ14_06050 [Marinilabiliaceae bacterium]|nr:hypothetical protein [Marinilabiliaceae bacterium]
MKQITIIIALLLSVSFMQAQNKKEEKLEKVRAQKIAFLTQKMNLSPDEAQVFWPVYNEFSTQKKELNKKKREAMVELKQKWDTATDAQKEAVADQMIAFRMEEAKLDQSYHAQFKDVLPIDKVLKLYHAELQFKNYLMKQIRSSSKERAPRADRPDRPDRPKRSDKATPSN